MNKEINIFDKVIDEGVSHNDIPLILSEIENQYKNLFLLSRNSEEYSDCRASLKSVAFELYKFFNYEMDKEETN